VRVFNSMSLCSAIDRAPIQGNIPLRPSSLVPHPSQLMALIVRLKVLLYYSDLAALSFINCCQDPLLAVEEGVSKGSHKPSNDPKKHGQGQPKGMYF